MAAAIAAATRNGNGNKLIIPSDWPFEHIPVPTYDEDGELEVDNFTCGLCKYSGEKCKCINHKYIHFFRPWFSCDVYTWHHTICRQFALNTPLYPYGGLEWDFIGGFDEWLRLWRKQWHPRKDYALYSPSVSLIRAKQVENREFSDDVYVVSFNDFINCNIIKDDGIHCISYRHIERSRDPKNVTGYKWVYEGAGIWVPWDNNRYIKLDN